MKHPIIALLVSLLVISGCERAGKTDPAPAASTPPAETTATDQTLTPEAEAIRGPQINLADLESLKDVVATAFGKGKYENSSGMVVAFSFDANLHEDGRGTGEFHHISDGGTMDLRGEIVCLSIDQENRRAWMGGKIVTNASSLDAFKGDNYAADQPVTFRIFESTEEADAPGQISDLIIGASDAKDVCANKAWPDNDAGTAKLTEGLVVVFP